VHAFGWLAAAIAREASPPPYSSMGSLPRWWRWTLSLAWAIAAEDMVDRVTRRDGVVRDSLLRGVAWS
jgi:hypothetical protein